MKVSVSLPDEDVEFLDTYADSQGFARALLWFTRPFGYFAPRSSAPRMRMLGMSGRAGMLTYGNPRLVTG